MTPGHKTSEMWTLYLLPIVATFLPRIADWLSGQHSNNPLVQLGYGVGGLLVAAAYAWLRTHLKVKTLGTGNGA